MNHSYIWNSEMINKGLSGNELLIYSIINAYSQDGKSGYYGGHDYLGKCIGRKRQTATMIINNLINKKLIYKSKDGRLFINKECQNIDIGSQNIDIGSQNIDIGSQNTDSHLNLNSNINSNINIKESVARARTHEENTHSKILNNEEINLEIKEPFIEFVDQLDDLNEKKLELLIKIIVELQSKLTNQQLSTFIRQHTLESRNTFYLDRLGNTYYQQIVNKEPDWLDDYIKNF